MPSLLFLGKDAPTNPNLQSLKPGDKAVRIRAQGYGDFKYHVDVVTITKIEGHQGKVPGKEVKNVKFDEVDQVHYLDEAQRPSSMLVGAFRCRIGRYVDTLHFPTPNPFTGIHSIESYLANIHPILKSGIEGSLAAIQAEYQQKLNRLQARKKGLETLESKLK